MKNILFSIIFLCLSNAAYGGPCNEYSQNAKFECANEGDNYATSGNYAAAKKSWKISCDKGLTSSCDSVKELEQNPQKFKAIWESDPSNKSAKEYVEKKVKADKENQERFAKVSACANPDANKEKCLSDAKAMIAANDTEKASVILNSLCKSNFPDACFELGGIHVRADNYEKAIQPYMTACSLGNSNSCVILQQVQTNVKMKADEKAREDQRQREIAAEKQRADEKLAEGMQAASKQIADGFAKGREYTPPQPVQNNNPGNKRTCNTKANMYGGGLTTECHDGY